MIELGSARSLRRCILCCYCCCIAEGGNNSNSSSYLSANPTQLATHFGVMLLHPLRFSVTPTLTRSFGTRNSTTGPAGRNRMKNRTYVNTRCPKVKSDMQSLTKTWYRNSSHSREKHIILKNKKSPNLLVRKVLSAMRSLALVFHTRHFTLFER